MNQKKIKRKEKEDEKREKKKKEINECVKMPFGKLFMFQILK